MASRRRLAAFAVLLACTVPLPATALAAEPTLSDRETARSLMEDGDAKRDKNDLRGALKSYEAADAIMHVPTTGLEVGRTQALLNMLLEARETLNRVARIPAKPGDPPPFEKARKAAEQLSAELAQRIPSVTVSVTGTDPGATPQIVFDGENVPAAASFAPRKVNPGVHVVIVKVGASERKEEVNVQPSEQKTVPFDFSAPAKPAAVVAAPPQTQPDKPQPEPEKAGGDSTPKILMFGGFGLAAVGVGVGAVTGLMSISKVNDVKSTCQDNHCPQSQASNIDSAKSLGTISTIAFVAGGVGAAVGVLGIVMSSKAAPSEPTQGLVKPRIQADVGPSWLGVSGAF
ncbi:MAG TPA: hypothetical protein VIF62_08520 [Labilithrix sp.]|jgi:hypothetical protein